MLSMYLATSLVFFAAVLYVGYSYSPSSSRKLSNGNGAGGSTIFLEDLPRRQAVVNGTAAGDYADYSSGREWPPKKRPWSVSITIGGARRNCATGGLRQCSGALISFRHILTSAACFYDYADGKSCSSGIPVFRHDCLSSQPNSTSSTTTRLLSVSPLSSYVLDRTLERIFFVGGWSIKNKGESAREWRSPCGWGMVDNFTIPTTSSPINDTRCLDEIAVVTVGWIFLLLEWLPD